MQRHIGKADRAIREYAGHQRALERAQRATQIPLTQSDDTETEMRIATAEGMTDILGDAKGVFAEAKLQRTPRSRPSPTR